MRIDKLDRFHPEEENQKIENPEKIQTEPPESTETKPVPEKVGFVEAAMFVGLLGLKAYLVYDDKKEKLHKAVDAAKNDFQNQPGLTKEIAGGLVAEIGSLVLEYQREQREQKLIIKQKFLSSLQKLATERNQIDLLKDYETLQGEVIQESLTRPQKRTGLTEEEKNTHKLSADPIEKARQEARDKFKSFIKNLRD